MNSKNKKKYVEQYGVGGPVNNFITSPEQILQENAFNWARAKGEGQNDPLAGIIDTASPILQTVAGIAANKLGKDPAKQMYDKGLREAIKNPTQNEIELRYSNQAATGTSTGNGRKKINVEGGEILENPMGDILKMKGASHEKGGIELELPGEGNYNVYSKRIKGITGKSLAHEKEAREKKIAKYQKYIQENPGDIVAKNTLDRLLLSSKKADIDSLNLQTEIKGAYEAGNAETQINTQEGQSPKTEAPEVVQEGPEGFGEDSDFGQAATGFSGVAPEEEEKNFLQRMLGDIAPGDIIGMLGLARQKNMAAKAASNNLASLKVEPNFYENYGKDSLAPIQANQEIIQRGYDRGVNNLELDNLTSKQNVANLSRGIAGKMTGMLAVDQNTNRATNELEDKFTQSTIENNKTMADTLKDIELKRAEGARTAYNNNEANLDNAINQNNAAQQIQAGIIGDIANIGNKTLERKLQAAAISAQSLYSEVDAQGNVTKRETTPSGAVPGANDYSNNRRADQEEKSQQDQALEAAKTDTPVNISTVASPTGGEYTAGVPTGNNFDFNKEKDNLNGMLQELNLKLDFNDRSSISEIQRQLGMPKKWQTGAFGAKTYEYLKKAKAGTLHLNVDDKTGIGVVAYPGMEKLGGKPYGPLLKAIDKVKPVEIKDVDFTSLKKKIAGKETLGERDPYKAKNPQSGSTASGKYQFIWSIHGNNIMRDTGVRSREEFLNSPAAQEKYMDLQLKEAASYAKKNIAALQKVDPRIGLEGAIKLYHFAGPKVIKDLISGKQSLNSKPNGSKGYKNSSLLSYLNLT